MKTYIIPFVLIMFVLVSCQDKGKQEVAALHKEVMGAHDEIMPKHMKLQNMKATLEEQLKELNAAGEADSATVVTYHAAIDKLDEAVKGMDDWMHNWDVKYEEKGPEKAISYLKEQKKIIEEVKEDFKQGEEMAKSLINE